MPYSTGVNQGPLMFGIDTPILSAASAGWPASSSPIEATMPATPALPKARYFLCIIFSCYELRVGATSTFFAHARSNEGLIERDCEYQRTADHHHLRVGRNVQQIQAVREDADEQHPERHADDRAAAAEQGDAAEHHRGHRLQRQRGAKRWLSGSDARGKNDRADRGADAAEDVSDSLDGADPDAGKTRRLCVAADRINPAAKPGVFQDDEGGQQDQQRDNDGNRY